MTPEQQKAMDKANLIRTQLGDIKKLLKTGDLDPLQIIHHTSLPLRAYDILRSLPRVGPTKARRALAECGLEHCHTLGGDNRDGRVPMTDRQKAALAECVEVHTVHGEPWTILA